MDWLLQKLLTIMTINASTKSKTIVNAINLYYKHQISV
jgi:hypothetical protein